MFVFRKIWRTLFSCYLRFEIHPFELLPTIFTEESKSQEWPKAIGLVTKQFIYSALKLRNLLNKKISSYLTTTFFQYLPCVKVESPFNVFFCKFLKLASKCARLEYVKFQHILQRKCLLLSSKKIPYIKNLCYYAIHYKNIERTWF